MYLICVVNVEFGTKDNSLFLSTLIILVFFW